MDVRRWCSKSVDDDEPMKVRIAMPAEQQWSANAEREDDAWIAAAAAAAAMSTETCAVA